MLLLFLKNNKISKKTQKKVRAVTSQLELFHYFPVGNRFEENFFKKEFALNLFKEQFGDNFYEVEEHIHFLLNQFSENVESKGVKEDHHLFTKDKVSQLAEMNYFQKIPLAVFKSTIKIITKNYITVERNGEMLFLYLWVSYFFNPMILSILEEFDVPLKDFTPLFIRNLLKVDDKDYDLISRKDFIEDIKSYVVPDIISYYENKTVGKTESQHIHCFIETIEELVADGTLTSTTGADLIVSIIKDYESKSIDMEEKNAIILKKNLVKLRKKTYKYYIVFFVICVGVFALSYQG